MGQFSKEIDSDFAGLLYSTSPLHDIGKVGIPDSILLKPGRLSDVEFEIMKTQHDDRRPDAGRGDRSFSQDAVSAHGPEHRRHSPRALWTAPVIPRA